MKLKEFKTHRAGRIAALVASTAAVALIAASAVAASTVATSTLTASTLAADRWDDALALIPPNAETVVVLPSPKQASDDLQQGIERMGRQEMALGGRPIDLLRSQMGIGAGFDDKGSFVAWSLPQQQWCVMIPVTDADAFVKSSLKPVETAGGGAAGTAGGAAAGADAAYTLLAGGPPVYVRNMGKHVLLGSSAATAKEFNAGTGLTATLTQRLGERGNKVARSGDVLVWMSKSAISQYAEQTLAKAQNIGKFESSGAADDFMQAYLQRSKEIAEATVKTLKQVDDAVFTADFDALGLGLRAFARFDPQSDLAKSAPGSGTGAASAPSAAQTAAALSGLLNRIPGAPFYIAGGVDLKAMGGLRNLRTLFSSLPMGERIQVPAWMDTVQDKIDAIQIAFYPSKLPILSGGLMNDAALYIRTSDAAAVKAALGAWVTAQNGEHDGMKFESTWEVSRELKDGGTASAYAVKQTPVTMEAGGGPMQRMVMNMIVGQRGLHGFAKDVPGGLVVTFSQRADVLDRAVKAASASADASGAPTGASPGASTVTLGSQGFVKSYAPWMMPQPNLVAFIGVNELLNAARQIMAAMQDAAGMGAIPAPATPVEPIAIGFRAADGAWESAIMVPSSALALVYDAAKFNAMNPGGAEDDDAGSSAPPPGVKKSDPLPAKPPQSVPPAAAAPSVTAPSAS